MEENHQPETHPDHLLEAHKDKMPIWAILILVLFLIVVGYIVFAYIKEFKKTKAPTLPEIQVIATNPFEGIELEAKSAFVWDVSKQKEIFSKNPNEVLPLASLTKLMTAIVAADTLPKITTITIDKNALSEDGDNGLYVDEKWLLKDILDFSLIVSSNDGARAIASVAGANLLNADNSETPREVFVEKMNEKAKILGLNQTYFLNESGLDLDKETPGALGSARDIAKLMERVITKYPDIIEATKMDSLEVSSLSNLSHIATNTNPYLGSIPGIVASKTGFTDLSGGNLVIAFSPGLEGPYIISVLGSSYEGRFTDVAKLVERIVK